MTGVQVGIFVIIITVFIALFAAVQHSGKDTNSIIPVPTIQQDIQQQGQSNLKDPLQNQAQQVIQPTDVIKQASVSAADLANLKQASVSATISTNKGDIELLLDPMDAPYTVKNFINKSQSGFYTNLKFHRVEDWVVQGGDPLGNGTGGGKMPTELNKKPFVAGSLGVARGGDIQVSNDSQFFITKSDASWLNGQYTNFGEVTHGMDVVQKLTIGDTIKRITITTK